MADEKTCPHCGKPVPPTTLGGICPECMLKAGLATQTEGPGATGPHGTKVVPPLPKPEEIAPLFPQLEILECLGRGGMGVVYKARQPRLNRLVALKILAREKEQDAQFAERFTREAQALARLSHPNIVAVHDFGETAGHCYLVMEFVDGLNLRQLLQAGKMPPEQALVIVPKICEALQYAHDQGIVHRDIKPENILLDKQGRVKIADFGIAKMLGGRDALPRGQADQQVGPTRLTEPGHTVGTPHYMAPEQIEKPLTVDHRADIYSLGVVFYEMLTGELPLGKFQPPSAKVQVDVRLDEVVLRALEKEPERRYQQVSEIKTDVETIASTAAPPANAGTPSQAMPAGDYSLDIGSCMRRGWLLVRSDFWSVVGVTLLVLLVTQAASSTVAGIILAGPLLGGLWLFYLKKIRSEPAIVGTAFSGFSIAFLQLFLAALVPTILIFIGFLCLILPGIYLAVAWIFTLALVVDKRLDFGSAMKLSRKTISRHWWKFFGFIIVLTLLNLVGVLCCFIGSLITIPVTLAALAYAHEDIFGSGAVKGNAPAGAPVEPTPSDEHRETIGGRGKIVAPAVALMAAAAVKLFSSTVTMKHFLLGWGLHFSFGWRFFIGACITMFMIVPALLVLFGAVKMMRLRGHKWAMAAAILALAFPPWFLIGVPAGIWALVVLLHQKVKQVFASQSPPVRMWPWFWGTALGAFLVVALALGFSKGKPNAIVNGMVEPHPAANFVTAAPAAPIPPPVPIAPTAPVPPSALPAPGEHLAMNSRRQSLHKRFVERTAQDQGKYTPQQLRDAEQLYEVANRKWGTSEAKESLRTMIQKYPDFNRTGCAVLYLAQMSQGDERVQYLQDCIEKYNDCFYGDGVQVGAYARFLLAEDYKSQGETAKAEALFSEIKAKYPGAIDHRGNLLVESLKTGSN